MVEIGQGAHWHALAWPIGTCSHGQSARAGTANWRVVGNSSVGFRESWGNPGGILGGISGNPDPSENPIGIMEEASGDPREFSGILA